MMNVVKFDGSELRLLNKANYLSAFLTFTFLISGSMWVATLFNYIARSDDLCNSLFWVSFIFSCVSNDVIFNSIIRILK